MGCAGSRSEDGGGAVVACATVEEFHRRYATGRELGKGNFGCVLAARPRAPGTPGPALAVKVLPAPPATAAQQERRAGPAKEPVAGEGVATREVEIWRLVGRHSNVVELSGVFVGGGSSCLILMERCQNGSIAELMHILRARPSCRRTALANASLVAAASFAASCLFAAVSVVCSDEGAPHLLRGMAMGIAHVHDRGVVHRDIKPANFLLGGAQGITVKLCDFGTAALLPRGPEGLLGSFGTAPYMSPEMVGGRGHGLSTDVWSFGASAYELLFGAYPYAAEASSRAMKLAIFKGQPEPPFKVEAAAFPWRVSPGDAADLVRPLLRRAPRERCSASAALSLPLLRIGAGHRWAAAGPGPGGAAGDDAARSRSTLPRLLGSGAPRTSAMRHEAGLLHGLDDDKFARDL